MERKYKVWDKIDKCWIPAEYLMMNPEGKIYTSLHKDGDMYLEETIPHEVVFYSGIDDKNNVEIFEGAIADFVIFDFYGLDTQHRGVVVYEGSCFFVKYFYRGEWCYDYLDRIVGQDDEFEVIGNIHEHPELLKD